MDTQLKARLYLGGLKSLFGDLHDTIAEIEKTGQMPAAMLQHLADTREAITATLEVLGEQPGVTDSSPPCCDHHHTAPAPKKSTRTKRAPG